MKNDGGTAFPQILGERYEPMSTEGMSLRDYFAAKAMQGMCSMKYIFHDAINPYQEQLKRLSEISYEVADAMLKAREGRE